jgi:hypothetical protein
VRHLFLETDGDGRQLLGAIAGRTDLPALSYTIESSNQLHVLWRVTGFTTPLAPTRNHLYPLPIVSQLSADCLVSEVFRVSPLVTDDLRRVRFTSSSRPLRSCWAHMSDLLTTNMNRRILCWDPTEEECGRSWLLNVSMSCTAPLR